VTELFPFREDSVAVARFQCTSRFKTFSLLPVQLIPYFRYTTSSVIGAILAMWILVRDDHAGHFGRLLDRPDVIHADSRVTVWLLETWLRVVLTGLRRTHAFLAQRPDRRGEYSVLARVDGVAQVAAYFDAWGVRAPPQRPAEVFRVFVRHGRSTNGFLVGTPSQVRGK